MKVSEQWLRTLVVSQRSLDAIATDLTTAGLEVDAVLDSQPPSTHVVVARIDFVHAHPHADDLVVCTLDIGAPQTIEVVCGAPNARPDLVAPCVLPGGTLHGGIQIEVTTVRGIESAGMLASAAELGLGVQDDRLWELPADAAPGTELGAYLNLPDRVLELDLTPNRGDCLSMLGVAREAAIIENQSLPRFEVAAIPDAHGRSPGVTVEAPGACPVYLARRVELASPAAATPIWMAERLRRAGIRTINLPVDIGNYAMLALGQPMHAFDGDKLSGEITVRYAAANEVFTTLDNVDLRLDTSTLVIADAVGPVAIAGMIGGARTAVDSDSQTIVLEAAHFTPATVAGQGRRYKIATDSLHRFERGVDPSLPETAIEYATAFLQEHANARPGPVAAATSGTAASAKTPIELRASTIERILGQAIADDFVETSLEQLGLGITRTRPGCWQATAPSWRFDLEREVDLVEEVARLYGYQNLAVEQPGIELPAQSAAPSSAPGHAALLCARGYHEAITYSFVDASLQSALAGDVPSLVLDNPISEQMGVMRTTLLPGLIGAWQFNRRRGRTTIRLFEHGLRFEPDASAAHGIAQTLTIAGIVSGLAEPTHWSAADRPLDYFDVKNDVEALFSASACTPRFEPAELPGHHPGRCAVIYCDGRRVGHIGQVSDSVVSSKNKYLPYIFEIDSEILTPVRGIRYEEISDQPAITRDLAVVVADDVPANALIQAVWSIDSDILQSVQIVDVFRGHDLDSGFKSVALRLIFQDKTSTLTSEQIEALMDGVSTALHRRCKARIRGQ